MRPRFVRRYAELGALATEAVSRFAADVRAARSRRVTRRTT